MPGHKHKVILKRDMYHLVREDEIVHRKGEEIEVTHWVGGMCGTFPFSHECPKCAPHEPAWSIGQWQKYFDLLPADEDLTFEKGMRIDSEEETTEDN